MSGSVLIVDDDDGIRASLRLALEDRGYAVGEAPDGESGIDQVRSNEFDVVVLDLMLPGIDGFECCRRMRRHSDLPILIVSARGDSHDVVAGLEAGADDYIRKPFEIAELAARLRALRRRIRGATGGSDSAADGSAGEIVVGALEINPANRTVLLDGAAVHLTKTEFRLLVELASRPGQVFTRDVLMHTVWDYGELADARIVDVHVARLRAKIETNSSAPRRLLTVRGFGYKLQA